MVKPLSALNGEIGKYGKKKGQKGGAGMVGILKHAGHEIGANGEKVNADKCAKMVKLVKW